jgi:hypothetical protein
MMKIIVTVRRNEHGGGFAKRDTAKWTAVACTLTWKQYGRLLLGTDAYTPSFIQNAMFADRAGPPRFNHLSTHCVKYVATLEASLRQDPGEASNNGAFQHLIFAFGQESVSFTWTVIDA